MNGIINDTEIIGVMAESEYILQRVKEAVLSFDSCADIFLYGSRARGTSVPESDWDFLILTESDLDNEKKREIRRAIYSIELETNEIISVIIHNKRYWNSERNSVTPFFQNIRRESIAV